DGVEDLGRAGTRHLLGEDDLLLQRRATPAVLSRPLDADPTGAGELALPGTLEDPSRVLVVGRRCAREMRREPVAQLRAEGFLLGRVAESEHAFGGLAECPRRGRGRDASRGPGGGSRRSSTAHPAFTSILRERRFAAGVFGSTTDRTPFSYVASAASAWT